MTKDSIFDARFVINSAILLLALLVTLFSFFFISDSYQTHKSSQYLPHINRIIDSSTDAAGLQAIERGMTSAILGMNSVANQKFYDRILQLRAESDRLWQTTQTEADLLSAQIPNSHAFDHAVQNAKQKYQQLEIMRAHIDGYINGSDKNPIELDLWVETITNFINAVSELRQFTLSITPLTNGIRGINNIIQQRVWLISEHAGLERAHISYYTAKREAIPNNFIRQLIEFRGVVEHSIENLKSSTQSRQHVDSRITDALQVMQQRFITDFENTREDIYAAASTGNYPYTVEEWVDKSTHAINSILAVGKVISQVSEEHAGTISRKALYELFINLCIITVAFIMTIWGMLKVHQTVKNLYHQKEMAEVTLHSIGDAVITTDASSHVEYLNPIAEDITGWDNTAATGKHLSEILILKNGFTMQPEPNPIEKCLRDKTIVGLGSNIILTNREGKEIMIEDSAAPIRDHQGNIVGAVMVFYDVTAMRNTPHLLSYHATHDVLTGLFNRREFERQLAELILDAKNSRSQHALCYIDLDQFKVINDTSGHISGDKLLQQLTFIIKEHVRDADMLARLGGDEFGLLLKNCNLDKALKIAETLRKVIKEFRFSWDKNTFEIGASIGLVPITETGATPEEILSEADSACYAAKEKGRNRIQVYQTGNLELARRQGEMQWVSRINSAINDDRFILYAQPIVSLNNDNHNHFEILLRLVEENGTIVEPMAFIPAAERYNLMVDIDYLVIKKSITLLAEIHQSEYNKIPNIKFSINLSGDTLGKEDLLDYIMSLLKQNRIPSNAICFEITETAAIRNLEQAATLIKALRNEGCSFALDDFGSGLCSFSYLKSLPVDYLKIDGAFVRNISTDKVNHTVVKSASYIARALDMQTIAEYVEDTHTINILKELDVDYAQGFGIGRPKAVKDWITEYNSPSTPDALYKNSSTRL
ncbi:MAG: EAL domain-containing protein [Gammaproteobacteria bacterium]|nr:EAL domain-containing protein [Gammaproteobacteria bacterium]